MIELLKSADSSVVCINAIAYTNRLKVGLLGVKRGVSSVDVTLINPNDITKNYRVVLPDNCLDRQVWGFSSDLHLELKS